MPEKRNPRDAPNDGAPGFSWKRFIIISLIVYALLMLFGGKNTSQSNTAEQAQSQFYSQLVSGELESVRLPYTGGDGIEYKVIGGGTYKTFTRGDDANILTTAREKCKEPACKLTVSKAPVPGFIESMGAGTLALIALFSFMAYMQWKMYSGGGGLGGGAGKFAQSKAERIAPDQMTTRFTDVAGVDEAVARTKRVIDFLTNPEKYDRMKAKVPRGVLLKGPPGCGKTLLARAIAGEAGVPFYKISGSEFVEMFVGVGASRVRQLFDAAESEGVPTMIFIDEIDAIGRSRSSGHGNNNDEREQTLNQILTRMDGFGERKIPIIVIAATNRDDILDAALLRPGRFDEKIDLGYPDLEGRIRILRVHMRGMPIAKSVNVRHIAQGIPRASGADIANIVNMAALAAVERNGQAVTAEDFEKAKDELTTGQARVINIMNEAEKRKTAYHEAGHAIVGHLMPNHDIVSKVTIVPHGNALGITVFLPEKERVSLSIDEFRGQIRTGYGGRAAEELVYGPDEVTSGAMGDIQHITAMMSAAIMQWGFAPKEVGLIAYAGSYGDHLAQGVRQLPYSEDTARKIDQVKIGWTARLYDETLAILRENRDKMEVMTEALMKWETIDRGQILAIMEGKKFEELPVPEWTMEKEIVEEEITIAADEKEKKEEAPKDESSKPQGLFGRFFPPAKASGKKTNK